MLLFRLLQCILVYPALDEHKDQDYILEDIRENRQELSAYHKVYKLGIALPIIS